MVFLVWMRKHTVHRPIIRVEGFSGSIGHGTPSIKYIRNVIDQRLIWISIIGQIGIDGLNSRENITEIFAKRIERFHACGICTREFGKLLFVIFAYCIWDEIDVAVIPAAKRRTETVCFIV